MRNRRLASLLLVAFLTAACGGVGGTPGGQALTGPKQVAATVDPRLLQAETQFSFDLLNAIRAEKPGENLFISPASVSLALAMTYNGAVGETQQAMAQALSADGMSVADVNAANAALQSVLTNPDPKVELSIANSIWYKKGLTVNPAFLATTRDHYRAEVAPVQFGHKDAAPTINQWVSKATRGKIASIIDRTDPQDRMYLVNAIYFNGRWQEPFEKELTQPRTFHLADGSTKEHPLMHQSGRYRYLKGEDFQGVALPYGEGRLSLYVLLPDEGVSLDQFAGAITSDRWTDWMSRFQAKPGSVALPKVKLEWGDELSGAMKSLGMGVAFDPNQADFSNLFTGTQESLFIGFILHKTFLDLNEGGTEAAAVTAVEIRAGSAPPAPEERFDLVVDRPYLLAIRDDQTGAILFLGAIYNPQ
jgi:serine protease inhibitor